MELKTGYYIIIIVIMQNSKDMVVKTSDKNSVAEKMKERIDRLMKQVQLEIEDGDLRVDLITRLIAIRELFSDERDSN